MTPSEWKILLLGAILLFIYIDNRFTKLERSYREKYTPVIPEALQQSYTLRAPSAQSYVVQARDAYKQYVPTKAEQLAAMTETEVAGTWETDFAKPLWDAKADKTEAFDMSQVSAWGADDTWAGI